jgi:endonuclease/exonuclease/phosphatase family metal-dependent hydrolase
LLKKIKELTLAANISDDTLDAHKCIRKLGRKLFKLPGLREFRQHAEKAFSTAEPAGKISILSLPERGDGSTCDRLTILSTNMWHDWPRHRRLIDRLEDIAQLAESQAVDVLLMQEITRTRDFYSDEWLSQRLGMAYVYSRANGHSEGIGFEEGLAIFSRFPISGPRINQLSSGKNPFVRRVALGANLATPCGEIMIFSVHLGLLNHQNAEQQSRLHAWVDHESGERPAVIGGDFNSDERSPQIRRIQSHWLDTFRSLHPTANGITHEIRAPWGSILHRARLDYIFLRNGLSSWNIFEANHFKSPMKPHSDHSAVLVRLRPEILPV